MRKSKSTASDKEAIKAEAERRAKIIETKRKKPAVTLPSVKSFE